MSAQIFNIAYKAFKNRGMRLFTLSTLASGTFMMASLLKVAPMVMSGDWLLASYLIVSHEHPNGWAGQPLFKNEGNRWVFKGDGNYIQDVNTLMEFGVPRQEAETLASGTDV